MKKKKTTRLKTEELKRDLKRVLARAKAAVKAPPRRRANGERAKPQPSKKYTSQRDRLNAKAQAALTYFLANPTERTPVERHADERGEFITIENVASFRNPIGSVAVLTRKKGSTFAEHFHKREGHTVHVVSGRVEYREKRGEKVVDMTLLSGEAVFSPPNVPHAFLALEDCVCVVVANISRTQEEYEADVTRLTGDEKLFSENDVLLATKQAVFIPGTTGVGLPSGMVGKTGQIRPETILSEEPTLYTPPEPLYTPPEPTKYDVDGEPV